MSLSLSLLLLHAAPARPQNQARNVAPGPSVRIGDLKEWRVPWPDAVGVSDPFPDAQGRIWFVGEAGNFVAYLSPATDAFKRFEIAIGTHPHSIVVRDSAVWFTGSSAGRLSRIDLTTGLLKHFRIPDSTVVRDPHALAIGGKAGMLWFTAQSAGTVGRFDPSNGSYLLWNLATGALPDGIALDKQGRAWFAEFGSNTIGVADASALSSKNIALPNSMARPRRIAVTSDDAVWYSDYGRGFLGRLDPVTGDVQEFAMPGVDGSSRPYGIAVDDRDVIWVAETGAFPNQLVAFDSRSRNWMGSIAVGSKAPDTIRHLAFDRGTREVWFVTRQGIVGRIRLP